MFGRTRAKKPGNFGFSNGFSSITSMSLMFSEFHEQKLLDIGNGYYLSPSFGLKCHFECARVKKPGSFGIFK
jgi:hypothetical protein